MHCKIQVNSSIKYLCLKSTKPVACAFWCFMFLSIFQSYFTDRSKAVLLLWIFYVFVLSCVCYVLCTSVYMCFVVTCWERADLLALVCGVFCEFVTFPLVSWVRCGTWLYRFLIFAPLLTFMISYPGHNTVTPLAVSLKQVTLPSPI